MDDHKAEIMMNITKYNFFKTHASSIFQKFPISSPHFVQLKTNIPSAEVVVVSPRADIGDTPNETNVTKGNRMARPKARNRMYFFC